MAEGVGVQNTPQHHTPTPGGKKEKQKRLLLFGAAGVGGVLLLAHKGGGTSGGSDPTGQADALAAEEAAMLNPPVPGGGAPVDTGGGSYTTQGPEATTAPAVTVNQPPATINVAAPAATSSGGHGHDKKHRGSKDGKDHGKHPHPKTGAKGKPAPAKSKGRGAGKHPDTHKRTEHGHKKHSPALVESMEGSGSGQVVMGRRFPGAIAHRLGAPKRQTDGSVARTVTVDYGGYTATHLVHNNGERWIDNAPGMNPPSRGVPFISSGAPI